MRKWNGWFEGFLYSPTPLAPELPASAQTPEDDFPAYYISDDVPDEPDNWSLKIGGLVTHPLTLTLDQLPGAAVHFDARASSLRRRLVGCCSMEGVRSVKSPSSHNPIPRIVC